MNVDVTSDSRANTIPGPEKTASIRKGSNFYAVEKIVGHENRPTGTYYTVRWYDHAPQDDDG